MAMFLNHNCSATAKQARDERSQESNSISMCNHKLR